MTKAKGSLVVISGPSGVGKGTICKELLKDENFTFSVSATTRGIRNGEINGVHYHFLGVDDFKQKIADGDFLEWAQVYDNYYGTLKSAVISKLEEGYNVLLDIDTKGAEQIKEKMPEALLFFVMPPSPAELEARLRGRGTDSNEVIEKRLGCLKYEMEQRKNYDFVVVNNTVDKVVEEIKMLLKSKSV